MKYTSFEERKNIKAASEGFSAYLQEMLRTQPDQSWMSFEEDTVLSKLYLNGHLDKMKNLISLGAQSNISDRKSQRSLAHTVASNGDYETLKWLKNNGCDLNSADKFGRTPFLCSLVFDKGPVFYGRLLLLGADPDSKTLKGENGIAIATRYGVNRSLEEALEILKKVSSSRNFEVSRNILNNPREM